MRSKRIFALIISILICELAGFLGSFFTVGSISTWYATLAKPLLNPPSWIFAPVWTTLYLLMGIAAFLVWKKGMDKKRAALVVFAGQLFLNAVWSYIFFGLHNVSLAFIDLALLWLALLATMILFFKISKAAGWLLFPYILWVSFAGYLNLSILLLNR